MYYLLGDLHLKLRSTLKSIQLLHICVAKNTTIYSEACNRGDTQPTVASIQELEKVL